MYSTIQFQHFAIICNNMLLKKLEHPKQEPNEVSFDEFLLQSMLPLPSHQIPILSLGIINIQVGNCNELGYSRSIQSTTCEILFGVVVFCVTDSYAKPPFKFLLGFLQVRGGMWMWYWYHTETWWVNFLLILVFQSLHVYNFWQYSPLFVPLLLCAKSLLSIPCCSMAHQNAKDHYFNKLLDVTADCRFSLYMPLAILQIPREVKG